MQNGIIHYIKTMDFNYYMAYNLIYQLYATEKRMKKNRVEVARQCGQKDRI